MKPDFKTLQAWHTYYVFNDPEFISLVKNLGDETATEAQYQQVADKYIVPIFEVKEFHKIENSALKWHWPIEVDADYSVYFDEERRKYYIELDANITKVKYDEVWNRIASTRDSVTTIIDKGTITRYPRENASVSKRKLPQETSLIYAIFKARLNGQKYSQIFNSYQSGTLHLYRGSTNQFKSLDALGRYYNKYRPDKKPAT